METACIGVKFCGHCQPRRDMTSLLEQLRAAAPDLTFVPWSTPGWKVLLVLQACDAACATPPETDCPRIEVIVSQLNFIDYDTDAALVAATLAAVRQALAQERSC